MEIGGSQLIVEEGRYYSVNRLGVEEGATIAMGRVLAVKDGSDFKVRIITLPTVYLFPPFSTDARYFFKLKKSCQCSWQRVYARRSGATVNESSLTLFPPPSSPHPSDLQVGQPYVEGATVQAEILGDAKGPKLTVYKMQRKKHTRSKNGHRQALTKFLVTKIN